MVVLPVNDCKWNFKEGDVAVLSIPRPGSGVIYLVCSSVLLILFYHCMNSFTII